MSDKTARPRPRGECVLFDAVPEVALARILSRGFVVEVPRGSTFYREGGPPRSFLVRSGLIRVYMQSAEGRQVTVRYARPNDLLGIAAAVAGPAPVAAQALVDSRLLAFDPAALAEEAHRDPVVAWAIAEELGRRLYESERAPAVPRRPLLLAARGPDERSDVSTPLQRGVVRRGRCEAAPAAAALA